MISCHREISTGLILQSGRLARRSPALFGSVLDQSPNFALSSSSSGPTCSALSSHDEYEPGPSIT